MFDYKYLSKEHLKGLEKYKYSAIDTSPLSNYVMHPCWNFSVKLLPKWIAPNLLTFAGFLCLVINVILIAIYDYDFTACGGPRGVVNYDESGVPDWLYPTCGVLLFLAYNMDGMDGKQARRIGVSGPLGELFDHGLDSYIVFLIPYCLISVFGRDHTFSVTVFRGYLLIMSVVLNFYVSHGEKYTTGTLYLPWGYDLSMWFSTLLFFLPHYFGPGMYKTYFIGDITTVQVLEVLVHATGLFTTLPVAIYNIHLYRKKQKGKKVPFTTILRPVWSMLVMTVTMTTWALKSPNNLIFNEPRIFILLFGTLFSNIASRLIVAEITSQKCDVIGWLAWPLLAGVATSFYLPTFETTVLYILTLFCISAHVHYGICVVRQICSYYKISCFTVPKEKIK